MALSSGGKSRGSIGPSMAGRFYTYWSNGRWIVKSWPKKSRKKPSEAQLLARSAFREVCRAIKGTAAEIQSFHAANAKGTPMLPRDTLMAALYGNGPIIKTYSGKVHRPMANKLLASTVLDAIAWTEGDLLVRKNDGWEPLSKGKPGQVLTCVETSSTPQWVDATGGGGLAAVTNAPQRGASYGDYRQQGACCYFYEPYFLRAISFIADDPLVNSLRFRVYSMSDASTLDELIHESEVVLSGSRSRLVVHHQLPSAVFLADQTTYWLALADTEATGSSYQTYRLGQSTFQGVFCSSRDGGRSGLEPSLPSSINPDQGYTVMMNLTLTVE